MTVTRSFAVGFIALASLALAGCTATLQDKLIDQFKRFSEEKPTGKVTLVSSQESTDFLAKPISPSTPAPTGVADAQGYYELARGKIVDVQLDPNGRYDIVARPPGYRDRSMTITSPLPPELRFTFEVSDKLSDSESAGPPPARKPEDAGVLPDDVRQSLLNENRWRALLIGISDYSGTDGYADSLKGIPANDVAQLKETLLNDYGFADVAVLADGQATRRGILAALTRLHETCKREDNVLIYYAGHGLLPSHGVGVWIPADAKNEEDGISNSEIKDRIANLSARRVLLVTDSCFAGAFLTRAVAVGGSEKIVKDQSLSVRISSSLAGNQRAGREVVTSGNLAPVPNSGSGPASQNSPFAYSLLTALRSAPKGSALSTTDIFVELYQTMKQQFSEEDNNRPRPQRATMPGHAGGEFFFVRR